MKNIKIKNSKFLAGAVTASLLMMFGQNASAHTRLENPVTKESSANHGTSESSVMIPHGCDGNPVIGNVFFMPDSTATIQTSTDNFETFEVSDSKMLDHIIAQPGIRIIKNRDVYNTQAFINDAQGNPIGFWAADGSLPASNWVGKLPFRITAVAIQPESCVKNVVFIPAIANICKLTTKENIGASDAGNVDFWAAPDVGTPYDGDSWSFPAKYTIERDLENNPLPESCGDGFDARIVPTAEQLDRNMPVKVDGVQVWPLPN